MTAARPLCARCLRPASACICAAVRPVASAAQVLVLMHPLEERQAKGTARLLHLCLAHSRIAVGEAWAPEALAQLLSEPWTEADRQAPRRPLLLYPATAAPAAQAGQPPPCPPATPALAEPQRLRLVVLDGTWRKSRRMLWCNPALQQLPRLALQDVPASRYAIRKAHAPHQLSTLEAVQLALQLLEPGNGALAALAGAMDEFVALQRARLPGPALGYAAPRPTC